MNDGVTLDFTVHFTTGRTGQRVLKAGMQPSPPRMLDGRVPRVSRLMALAIRFEQLLSIGAADDYAELARLSHVTRARLTQIMNLRLLAPEMQEAILFLPTITSGRDRILLRHLQRIALTPDWRMQRQLWKRLNSVGPKVSEPSE